jgi:hypothetical protein
VITSDASAASKMLGRARTGRERKGSIPIRIFWTLFVRV